MRLAHVCISRDGDVTGKGESMCLKKKSVKTFSQKPSKQHIPVSGLGSLPVPPGVAMDMGRMDRPKYLEAIAVLHYQYAKASRLGTPAALRRYEKYIANFKRNHYKSLDSQNYILRTTSDQKSNAAIRRARDETNRGITSRTFTEVAHKFAPGTLPLDRPDLTTVSFDFIDVSKPVEPQELAFEEKKMPLNYAGITKTPNLAIPAGWVYLEAMQQLFVERDGKTYAFGYVEITLVGSFLGPDENALYDGKFLNPTFTLKQAMVWPDATIKIVKKDGLIGGGKGKKKRENAVKNALDNARKAKAKGSKPKKAKSERIEKPPPCNRRHRPTDPCPRCDLDSCFVCNKRREEHPGGKYCPKPARPNVRQAKGPATALAAAFDERPVLAPSKLPKLPKSDEDDLRTQAEKFVDERRRHKFVTNVVNVETGESKETINIDAYSREVEDAIELLKATRNTNKSSDSSEDGIYVSESEDETVINFDKSGSPPAGNGPNAPPPPESPVTKDDIIEISGYQEESFELRTEKKIWTYERDEDKFDHDLDNHLASAYFMKGWIFYVFFALMVGIFGTNVWMYLSITIAWLAGALPFEAWLVAGILQIGSHQLFCYLLKHISWRPWTSKYLQRLHYLAGSADKDFFLLPNEQRVHKVARRDHVGNSIHMKKSRYTILTDHRMEEVLDDMAQNSIVIYGRYIKFWSRVGLLNTIYPHLISPTSRFFKSKYEYARIEPEQIQWTESFLKTIDMRSKAKSMAKIEVADPAFCNVKFMIGRNNQYKEKKLMVSMAMIAQAVSYEGLYYSDTAESLDHKIVMFCKNSHFINTDLVRSMKDNVAQNTMLFLKYYLRYKHVYCNDVDVTKNVPLASL